VSALNLPEVKKIVRLAAQHKQVAEGLGMDVRPGDAFPLPVDVCVQLVQELDLARGNDRAGAGPATYDCLVFETVEGESERFHRDLRRVDREAARIFAEAWTRPPRMWEGREDQSVAREWDRDPRVIERRAVVIKVDRSLVVTMTGDRDGRRVDDGRF
jgi:hypothetical protein